MPLCGESNRIGNAAAVGSAIKNGASTGAAKVLLSGVKTNSFRVADAL
jgi:hypothetical protein